MTKIAAIDENVFYFSQKGYCPCCEEEVMFKATNFWLRDYFVCSNCGSVPRERALIVTIEKYYPNWKELSIHESSPANRGASSKLRKYCKNYVASQYYPNMPFGKMIDGFRNENLEQLTFSDETFDITVTQDVMEHVYAPEKAFAEIARSLKKGGSHIFTVPIVNKHDKTIIWATKGTNGEPVFIHSPEYHGNPVDAKGAPVTMHWGFDIVDFIKRESGLETRIEYNYSLNLGIMAEYIEVLVSRK